MKKLFAALAAGMISLSVFGQTYPSPTFNSLTLQNPLTVTNGGTGTSTSTGSGSLVLSNSPTLITPALGTPSSVTLTNGTGLPISTGVSGLGTGVAAGLANAVTGSGSPVLATSPAIASPTITGALTATGLVTTSDLATQAANTILANGTGSTASPTAVGMPSCSAAGSALQWTSGTGPACTTGLAYLNSPTFTGTPAAPTAALGTNTTQLATTAFVANHAPCPSIMDYGGNNGGSVDNSTAFANAAAAGPGTQACVYFPPGSYAFSANAVYTTPFTVGGITIKGAGADQSKLIWTGGGGLTLNLKSQVNYVHVRDLSLLTGTTNTGSALYINQTAASVSNPAVTSNSDVSNVLIRGSDGLAQTDYWQYGIRVFGVSNIDFNGVTVFGANTPAGTGLYISGSSSVIPVVFNILGSSFNQLNVGFQYGNYTQGVTINASNFTQDNYGISVASGLTGLDQLAISNSQFNDYTDGILVQSSLENIQLSNNLFIVYNNSNGANLSNTSVTTVTGNTFEPQSGSPTNATGLIFGTYVSGSSVVTGNAFFTLTTGLWLQAASQKVLAYGNTYLSNTTNITDSGTGNQALFSLGSVGYEWSPNGELHQWGTSTPTTDTSGNFTVSFPKTFPTAVHRCIVNNGDSTIALADPFAVTNGSTTTSTLAGKVYNISSATAIRVNWDCVGN